MNSKSIAWLPIGGSVGLISAAASTVLISRSLGPDLRGELYSIFAVVFLASVITVGGDGLQLRRELSIRPEGGGLGTVFRELVLRSLPLLGLMVLLALYLEETERFRLGAELLVVNALSLTSISVSLLLSMVHLGRSNYALASLNALSIPLSHLSLSVLIQNPESLSMALSIANMLVPICLVFITLPKRDLRLSAPRLFSFGNNRRFLGAAIFPHFVGRIEIILCLAVSGAATSGYVSIGHGFAAGILPVSQLLTEGLFSRAARGQMVGKTHVVVRNLLLIFLSGLTVSVVVFFLIPLILGEAFNHERSLIALSTLSSTVGVVAVSSSQILIASGASKTGKRVAGWLMFATCTSILLAAVFENSPEVILYVFLLVYLLFTVSNVRQLKGQIS